MTQPILSFQEDAAKPAPKAIANLLPCRIHHDGPVDPIQGYWQPSSTEDGAQTAYFRGRKLQGKTVTLPEQYRGILVQKQPVKPQQPRAPEGLDQNASEEQPAETGTLQVNGTFDEIVVWEHEKLADGEADPYIRGIEEWLQVAEQIHSYPVSSDMAPK